LAPDIAGRKIANPTHASGALMLESLGIRRPGRIVRAIERRHPRRPRTPI